MINSPLRAGIVLLGFCVVGALSLGQEGAGDAGALELISITPQILSNDETTDVTVTGTGFLPEMQLALIGGGIAEVGRLRIPGIVVGLAMSEGLTFVTGNNLTIVDTSRPDAPTLVGKVRLGFTARAVAVRGDYAYLAGFSQARLGVVDVSDPSLPALVNTRSLGTCFMSRGRVLATEGALYLGCSDGRLLVGSLADPANPVVAAGAPFGTGAKLGMAIRGDRLYVLDELSGLFILDLRDPLAPRVMGVEQGVRGVGITVEGDLAYVVGDAQQGLQVVDVRDSERPRLMGAVPTLHEFDDPAVAGGFVFTGNDKRLWVYDARDPGSPVGAYEFDIGTTVFDLERSGALMVVADQGLQALRLFVVDRPESPGLIHQVDGIGRVAPGLIVGQRAYLRVLFPGTRILDISNPHGPELVGCLSSGGLQDVEGHHAFLAQQSRLEIWEVGNARRPRRAGVLEAPERISDVAVEEGIAYVGLQGGEVLVVDVSRPSVPAIVATIPPAVQGGRASSLHVSGNRLVYLASEIFQDVVVPIVDVTEPGAPEPLGALSLPWLFDGGLLAVAGDVGFLAASRDGLHVLDLSQPTAPTLSTTISGFEAITVSIAGESLFVLGPPNLMFDISEPLRPRLSGGLTWSGGMAGIVDDLAYLASGDSGLQVVQAKPPQPRPVIEGPALARLQVPPGLAPGLYHLMALQPDGRTDFLHNAVEVRGEPKPRHRFMPGRGDDPGCPSVDR